MDHWFDTLARPHTRRTAVRSAVLAAGALLLPVGRLPSASANSDEPCYHACQQLANAVQDQADQQCAKRYGVRSFAESVPLLGGTLTSLRNERWTGCNAVASCQFYQDSINCSFRPDCGDPSRYPGGQLPTPVPTPPPGGCDPGEVLCGGVVCCNPANKAECVQCNGKALCCRIGGMCCNGR